MAIKKPNKKGAGTINTSNATEKKAGSSNLVVLFALMMAVFLVGAGMVFGYFKFLDPDKKETAAETKKEAEVAMHAMELGDMVVNLADREDNHYLKLTITIEYPADKKIEEKIKEKNHLITETILLTLRSKDLNQVRPPEAIDQLKNELVTAINNRLGEQVIGKIYFTEYIVQ